MSAMNENIPSQKRLMTANRAVASSSSNRPQVRRNRAFYFDEDVSREVREHNFLLDDPSLQNPNEKSALESSNDIFFDLNPRWRRAYMQELHRQAVSATHTENDVVLLCPDDTDCVPADALDSDDSVQDALDERTFGQISGSYVSATQHFPLTPRGKEFIRSPKQVTDSGVTSSKFEDPSYSPVGVDGMECGRVHFWHRSLAWSEDCDEENHYIDGDQNAWLDSFGDRDEIRRYLALPTNLGKEDMDPIGGMADHGRPLSLRMIQKNSFTRRQSFTPRRVSQKKERSSLLREEIDMDCVTAVHWEEKIFSVMDLQEIARTIR